MSLSFTPKASKIYLERLELPAMFIVFKRMYNLSLGYYDHVTVCRIDLSHFVTLALVRETEVVNYRDPQSRLASPCCDRNHGLLAKETALDRCIS